jgi:hypothetical protein
VQALPKVLLYFLVAEVDSSAVELVRRAPEVELAAVSASAAVELSAVVVLAAPVVELAAAPVELSAVADVPLVETSAVVELAVNVEDDSAKVVELSANVVSVAVAEVVEEERSILHQRPKKGREKKSKLGS